MNQSLRILATDRDTGLVEGRPFCLHLHLVTFILIWHRNDMEDSCGEETNFFFFFLSVFVFTVETVTCLGA